MTDRRALSSLNKMKSTLTSENMEYTSGVFQEELGSSGDFKLSGCDLEVW